MENDKMKLVHKGGKTLNSDQKSMLHDHDTLAVVPSPPAYLSPGAKKHYKLMAGILVKQKKLKEIFLDALAIYAANMEQFEWACREIISKNKKRPGAGWLQKYSTGAVNISPEVTLRKSAEAELMRCFKQFGLDPRSEKELKQAAETGQYDIFSEFLKEKTM